MKRFLSYVCMFCALLALCGCSTPQTPSEYKLQIVSTNFASYDFARQLSGDKAEVFMLLAPGQESHSFEPTPQDIILLTKADLLIMGGGESDAWINKLIAASELDENKVLSMMDCVDPIPQEHTHETGHAHDAKDHSKFYAYDEHVWTAPKNAMAICKQITKKLMMVDEANALAYTEHLNAYLTELSALDQAFTQITSTGVRRTLVFADRFPFRYFADSYGLTYFAAFPGCSGETEPDAATMKFLIDKVQAEQLPAVFYTELSNRKVADAMQEATGAKTLLLHSCHNVTKDEFECGETYVSLMQQNATRLKEALY